jgi:hypothetical protein
MGLDVSARPGQRTSDAVDRAYETALFCEFPGCSPFAACSTMCGIPKNQEKNTHLFRNLVLDS